MTTNYGARPGLTVSDNGVREAVDVRFWFRDSTAGDDVRVTLFEPEGGTLCEASVPGIGWVIEDDDESLAEPRMARLVAMAQAWRSAARELDAERAAHAAEKLAHARTLAALERLLAAPSPGGSDERAREHVAARLAAAAALAQARGSRGAK